MNERPESVQLAECVHCGSLTIEPQSDRCACGEELYPSIKSVKPGTRIMNASFDEVKS